MEKLTSFTNNDIYDRFIAAGWKYYYLTYSWEKTFPVIDRNGKERSLNLEIRLRQMDWSSSTTYIRQVVYQIDQGIICHSVMGGGMSRTSGPIRMNKNILSFLDDTYCIKLLNKVFL